MTIVAFDTLKLAERLHDSGFTRKQATGAAEALAEVLTEVMIDHPGKDVVIEAVQEAAIGIGNRIDATERRLGSRIENLEAGQVTHTEAIARLEAGQAAHGETLTRLETLLGTVLEGQAVLLQNDMEIRRRLEGGKP